MKEKFLWHGRRKMGSWEWFSGMKSSQRRTVEVCRSRKVCLEPWSWIRHVVTTAHRISWSMAFAEGAEWCWPIEATCFWYGTLTFQFLLLICFFLEGLQVTASETVAPKAPAIKKKGKRGGAPRQRQVRITNTHLKGEIDLAREFTSQSKWPFYATQSVYLYSLSHIVVITICGQSVILQNPLQQKDFCMVVQHVFFIRNDSDVGRAQGSGVFSQDRRGHRLSICAYSRWNSAAFVGNNDR